MRDKIVTALKVIMILQGLMWIVFGIISLAKPHGDLMTLLICTLMPANGVLFIIFALIIKKDKLLLKVFTFAFIIVNLILTVTDQTGLFDYCVLVLNIITLFGYIYFFISGRKQRGAAKKTEAV